MMKPIGRQPRNHRTAGRALSRQKESMIEIGIYQELTVVSLKEQGVYLGEKEDADRMERVLLPKKQVPEGTEAGDKLRVFVYRDSSDRLIATTAAPALTLHQVARLRVAQTGGALS